MHGMTTKWQAIALAATLTVVSLLALPGCGNSKSHSSDTRTAYIHRVDGLCGQLNAKARSLKSIAPSSPSELKRYPERMYRFLARLVPAYVQIVRTAERVPRPIQERSVLDEMFSDADSSLRAQQAAEAAAKRRDVTQTLRELLTASRFANVANEKARTYGFHVCDQPG